MDHVHKVAKTTGATVLLTNDPQEACANVNVISTDTWVSMGEEAQQAKRLLDFKVACVCVVVVVLY
jgi:ornithine carbamoyltransferase